MKSYEKREQERWDEAASGYEDYYVATKGALFDKRERAVLVSGMDGPAVSSGLDLGAGTGRITEAMAPHVDRLVSLDISQRSLMMLREKDLGGSVVCASAAQLPFPAQTFDSIVSCQLFQSMRFDEVISAFFEVHRILKQGGRFAFSVTNLHYWRTHGVVEFGDPEGVYNRPFTDGSVRYLADRAGFDVERLGYYKALPLRRFKNDLWLSVDRSLGSLPLLRKRLNALLYAVLRKRS
jgi:ubiquinone/menaquinone biosynthesis C-methylase UbiE